MHKTPIPEKDPAPNGSETGSDAIIDAATDDGSSICQGMETSTHLEISGRSNR